ncbi:hypothetical protein B4U80_13922 [Leptotrombidium deliense]|uniref:C2H2-type domain-containing protein n=1 Tax=Leptotrombidium deliense TaxID=299467 RepID=A0A443S7H9_9ACAR|nr:hypothetical protein B4U80_13922 [Leptotrombidium deliense]
MSLADEKERLLSFLDDNARQLITKDVFLTFPYDLIVELLCRNTFCANELEILKAVLRWHEYHENEHLKTVLLRIRWCNITPIEYSSFVRPLHIITDDEYFRWNSETKPRIVVEQKDSTESSNQIRVKTEFLDTNSTESAVNNSAGYYPTEGEIKHWLSTFCETVSRNKEQHYKCKVEMKGDVLDHIVYVHERGNGLKCVNCNEEFITKDAVSAHTCDARKQSRNKRNVQFESYHSYLRNITCLKCGAIFQKKNDFVEHQKLHRQVRTHWQRSNKSQRRRFKSNTTKQLNKSKFYQDSPITDKQSGCFVIHTCCSCGKRFDNKQRFNDHYRKIHRNVCWCNKCDALFTNRGLLYKHAIKMH